MSLSRNEPRPVMIDAPWLMYGPTSNSTASFGAGSLRYVPLVPLELIDSTDGLFGNPAWTQYCPCVTTNLLMGVLTFDDVPRSCRYCGTSVIGMRTGLS